MFEQSVLMDAGKLNRGWKVIASFRGHVCFIALFLLLPVISPEALPMMRIANSLIAPAAPPAPRAIPLAPVPKTAAAPRAFAGLTAPSTIPPKPVQLV